MRVMLVDDDAVFRTALADSLSIAGFQPEIHRDGHSALASLKPDYDGVVVTDIRMPRVDGHSVLNS
ncbi:response regulator, partial [Agrobacterium sp. NPDC089420]|uniref:response regulator n=1 Tax=Agrobacterium sp. NPDC089420 TaxID=3363918 RepID=UPI00384F289B